VVDIGCFSICENSRRRFATKFSVYISICSLAIYWLCVLISPGYASKLLGGSACIVPKGLTLATHEGRESGDEAHQWRLPRPSQQCRQDSLEETNIVVRLLIPACDRRIAIHCTNPKLERAIEHVKVVGRKLRWYVMLLIPRTRANLLAEYLPRNIQLQRRRRQH
jgi:hypothetical protein